MSAKYSYRLSDEFVQLLANEFPISSLVENYKKAVENTDDGILEDIEKEVFGTFGRNLADRICEVEENYRDRNAEIIYKIADQTGHPFPSIQQRLIEIAILALMIENKTQFSEISYKRLAYKVSKCVLHDALTEALGKEVADKVPCKYFCIEMYKGICENTGVKDVTEVTMQGMISDEKGACVFSGELTLEEKIRLGSA